jgi:predicted MFS family arabinose efflux permease
MSDLREGLAHIAGSDLIRSLFVVTAFTGIFFVGTYQAVLPIFARDVLEVGSIGYGLLSAALGVGMFAGSIFIATRGDFARKGNALLWSLLVGSLVFLVFAVSRWFALSLLMMLAWGFSAAFFMNLTITLIQSHTPDRLMGRVMSVQALAFFGVTPLGNIAAGVIAELASPQAAAIAGAAAVAAMTLVLFARGSELLSEA